ncbi:hypothetical protein FACS1894202_10260 [Clostridia bacterium]|nr:hypothetical protein FACS1894202_10260 [Clostridia bacterium]
MITRNRLIQFVKNGFEIRERLTGMNYFYPSDSIEKIGLSRRSQNVLCRNGFLAVEQFMQLTPERLRGMRNLGEKSINEILESMRDTAVKPEDSESPTSSPPREVTLFRDTDGILRADIPIGKLGLSVRAVNCLTATNIQFASQLIGMTTDDLLSIRNMGRKTAYEIIEKIQSAELSLASETKNAQEEPSARDTFCRNVIERLKEQLLLNAGTVYADLQNVFDEFVADVVNLLENRDVWTYIFDIPLIHDALNARTLEICASSAYGISRGELAASVPEVAVSCGALGNALHALFEGNQLWMTDDGMIARNYPSILEYAAAIPNAKGGDFLTERLNGLTLEEIGSERGLTRERVRQVVQRLLQKRPPVAEDRYTEVYSAYNWTLEDFSLAFAEPESTYTFLVAAHDKCGTKDLEGLLEDTAFPLSFRKAAERVVYKNYITIGDERVPAKRLDLVDYVLRTHCCGEMRFDEFVTLYNAILVELELAGNPKFEINEKSYINRFADSPNVLWKYSRRFRYYDTEQYDFTEFFDTLALEQYVDIEYSALKFLRDYPDIMEQYDIRDEYELHNLLKTMCAVRYPAISFKRMPNIEFGTADRDMQVLNLLMQLAPISNNDFAAAYEREYGVLSGTVLANYVSCISEYLVDGVYRIDMPPLPIEHKMRMNTILTEDFYQIDDIARLYLREFPAADRSNINAYTLKTLGFKIYDGYVIGENYPSATDYFRSLLHVPDIVDLRRLSAALTRIGGFNSELYKVKSDFDIVEFTPLQFISIRRLEAVGITKDALREYSDAVLAHPCKSKYFTIKSLRNEGFSHSLDVLGLEDWFYASLLTEDRNRFAYCRAGGTKVFRKGNATFSLKDIIAYVVEREISIDIEDLAALLEVGFGIKVDRWKITELTKNSAMHYSPIMEKVYVDYDTYLEEV